MKKYVTDGRTFALDKLAFCTLVVDWWNWVLLLHCYHNHFLQLVEHLPEFDVHQEFQQSIIVNLDIAQ